MATLQTILPAPPLRPFVSTYLFLNVRGEGKIPAAPPQLSSGFAFLWGDGAIRHGGQEDQLPPRYVIPITTEAFGAYGTSTTVIGVKFFPGKFFEFFGCPQHLFFDTTIPLDTTDFGREAALLHEQLDEAALPEQQAKVVDHFLLSCLPDQPSHRPLIDWVLDRIYQSPELQHLHSLKPELNVSLRHLRRLFREYTGLNPRSFIRVFRFYRAYFLLLSGSFSSFTEVALKAGYFDQAHFIHEFKHFLGMTPSAYLKQASHPEEKLAWEGLQKKEELGV